jgi:hypothetical protein
MPLQDEDAATGAGPPGFPLKIVSADQLSCGFLYEKPHTLPLVIAAWQEIRAAPKEKWAFAHSFLRVSPQ